MLAPFFMIMVPPPFDFFMISIRIEKSLKNSYDDDDVLMEEAPTLKRASRTNLA